jgi:hypothetical protein
MRCNLQYLTSSLSAEEFPLEDSKRLCVYLLEAAMAQLPAGSETLLGIFDLRGFRNRNADLGFVRFLVRRRPFWDSFSSSASDVSTSSGARDTLTKYAARVPHMRG